MPPRYGSYDMKLLYLTIVLILTTVPSACPPTPPRTEPVTPISSTDGGSEPLDDAGDLDASRATCDTFCRSLKAAACPEGLAVECVPECNKVNGVLTDLHLACVTRAKTQDAVRSCGLRCKTHKLPPGQA